MAEVECRVRRILLALDSSEDAVALEAAAELALGLQASLRGLFIEDVELLRLAALPFATEVSLGPARTRRLEVDRLERELKRQAERLRSRLALAAARHRRPWTFHVVRGNLLESIRTAAEAADLYVLGRPAGPARNGRRGGGPVLVLYDGTGAADHAIEAALALAAPGAQLLVVVPQEALERDMERQVHARLLAAGHPARLLSIRHAGPADLAAGARQQRAELLVLPEGEWLRDPSGLRRLLTEAVCPVVIAR